MTRAVLDQVGDWVRAHREQAIGEWADWIAQPSVSSDGTGFPAAKYGADLVRRCGLTPETVETGGRPVILGTSPDGPAGNPHVLIYGHYDVQPPGPLTEWRSPPFEPASGTGACTAAALATTRASTSPSYSGCGPCWRWPARCPAG